MNPTRIAALAVAMCLGAPAAYADDYSGRLSDGATPAAHQMVPSAQVGNSRTMVMALSADAAGSASAWCTFKSGIVPQPGVAGSFEIVAGAPGMLFKAPGPVPQRSLTCAPLPNQTADLTIEALQ